MSLVINESSTAARHAGTPPYACRLAWQAYLPIEEGIPEAARQGFDLAYCDFSSQEDSIPCWTPAKIDRVNALQKTHGIGVIGHSDYRLPFASGTPEVAAAALAANFRELDLCARLGAPLLVHGGPGAETRLIREARQRGLETLANSLTHAQRRAADLGVQLILENLSNHRKPPFMYFGTTTEEIAQLLDAVRGMLALVDVGHANVNGGDPVSMFRRLAHRVWGLSLSNNAGLHDSHSALDQGTIDFPALRDAFDHTGWSGVIGFETRGADLAANLMFLDTLERAHQARRAGSQ